MSQSSKSKPSDFLQHVLLGMDLPILCWSKEGKLLYISESALRIFDSPSSESFTQNYSKFSPKKQPDLSSSVESKKEHIEKALEKGSHNFVWVHVLLDGTEKVVEYNLKCIEYQGEFIIIERITEVSQAREIRRVILDTMPLAVNFWNKHFEVFDCNAESVKLFGATNKQEVIDNYKRLSSHLQLDGTPSDIKVKHVIKEVFEKGYLCFEWMHQDIQGNSLPVEVTLVRSKFYGDDIAVAYLRDLREFKAMLHEVNEAKEQALQSAKARGEFLANISHEIRTPMNGVLGLLHLLGKTDLQSKQKGYVSKALFSANNLLNIIKDILDFSKIESGKLKLELAPFRATGICQELYDFYVSSTKAKDLEFHFSSCEPSCEYILGDSRRLKQILSNLINNAIKFTQEGRIELSVKVHEQTEESLTCLFCVSDTGIGIKEEKMQELFAAFSQADNSSTRQYGGTGLGLSISHNLVSLMQGEMWVDSIEGQGAKFYFTAKFGRIPDAKKNSTKACAEGAKSKGHLLLVEDNEINQLIAEELLISEGYSVDIANNGQEALDMLQRNNYKAVLMDIQMPVLDGLSASKKIREQEQYQHLPVIAMSAHAMTGDKEISLAHGMNDHVAKPIVPEVLFSTLQQWIDSAPDV